MKNIFLTAILIACALLVYVYAFIHPAYRELLVENAEDEAVRFATFLVSTHHFDQPLSRDHIPEDVTGDIGRLHGDEMLVKLRIFSPAGEIVYSTVAKEIGDLNTHDYFHDFVAAGNVYSKTVKKNTMTAEMEIVSTDMVETYVPIMHDGQFIGAIETYYDITASSARINDLTRHSMILLTLLAGVMLGLLYFALYQADISILARIRAEDELRQTNDELESRVKKRAGELVEANDRLTREIAERTLAQMALSEALAEMREDKEKISGILRSVNDGLLVLDSDRRIVLLNTPAREILGLTDRQDDNLLLSDVSDEAGLTEPFSHLLSGEVAQLDFEKRHPGDGRVATYQARTSQLRDDDGNVLGLVILMQDVTRERALDQMKADFLAMAAHELSTPLTTIIGYTDLLADASAGDLAPEIKRESLVFIHDKANALARIVDDLLDISRIESGQQLSIRKQPIDLCRELERAVMNYSEMHNGHTIRLEQCDVSAPVPADPVRIGQVLENILSNAVKYTPKGGEIRISSARDGNFQRIDVSDSGIGMSADQLEQIFDKFYRADASETAGPGIGLGMSITRHIINSHGGTISVTSRPGEGTRVSFTLPLAPSQTPQTV